MKKSLTLGLALIALAVFTNLSIAEGGQQKDKPKSPPTSAQTKQPTTAPVAPVPGADTKKLVADAIASSIVMLKGKAFPLFAKGSGPAPSATGGASCELYDSQPFTHGAAIDIEGGMHVPKTTTFPSGAPQEAIYSPPNADWLVQSYRRVITSAGDPYVAADSAFPAGYSFLTNSSYSSVSTTMHSFVGSLNVPDYIKADLNIKLDTLISNISAYSFSLSGSHGTVRHTAQVWGTGVINPKTGHAWYHGYIDGTLTCAPAYLHDQNALIARLKAWVNTVIHRFPPFANSDVKS